jgi:3-methyladenine DNA glycosylase/8-oxoguanine DNA glycosylase
MIERRIVLGGPLDLARTLAPLAHGRADRTIRLERGEAWIASHTPEGPAAIRIVHEQAGTVVATAWGAGADWALRHAPELIGEGDEPGRLVARHEIIHDLQRRHPGLRLPASRRTIHALVPAILEQKVTGTEAFRAYASLLRVHGTAAPGPGGLVLPPAPSVLAATPYYAFHPLGIERRRATAITRAATRADWLEAATHAVEAARRLAALPGIGPWTVAEVTRSAHGDPDAISVGDYHMPNTVAWALAGEPRADDARMLELLEPYRGQRGRVQRLLEVARIVAPRFGPRLAPRRIAAI